MIKKVNSRITEDTAKWYGDHFRSTSAGCEYALTAFQALYRDGISSLKGRISADDLLRIIEEMGRLKIQPIMPGVALEMAVKKAALSSVCSGLSTAELYALEIWAARYWIDRPEIGEYLKGMQLN